MERIKINDVSLIQGVAEKIYDNGDFVVKENRKALLGFRGGMSLCIGVTTDGDSFYINKGLDVELEWIISEHLHEKGFWSRTSSNSDNATWLYIYKR